MSYRTLLFPFIKQRTRAVTQSYNPSKLPDRPVSDNVSIYVYDYNATNLHQEKLDHVNKCLGYYDSENITWVNVDGIRKEDIEKICSHYKVHALLQEDILSVGQRPKMDEIDNVLFCLLNMLYYNEETGGVEQEQVSIALGSNFVLTFQEDATRDVFNPIRDKIKLENSKIRQSGPDFLYYSLIDIIVDNYFVVMEHLGERIELIEEEIIRTSSKQTLNKVNQLRKEMIVLKRNLNPVRDLVGGILRSDSILLHERVAKYFKNIYDHIMQANDLSENYRDMVMSLQDLYLNNVNLKMNEIMKFLAIVTALLGPATVITGIFGMNFDNMPMIHTNHSFFWVILIIFSIPIIMLWFFWKHGWFKKEVTMIDDKDAD
mgnify:CR=1 FL=1